MRRELDPWTLFASKLVGHRNTQNRTNTSNQTNKSNGAEKS